MTIWLTAFAGLPRAGGPEVGDRAAEGLGRRPGAGHGLVAAAAERGQRAALGALGAAGDRGVDEQGAPARELAGELAGDAGRDGGAVHQHRTERQGVGDAAGRARPPGGRGRARRTSRRRPHRRRPRRASRRRARQAPAAAPRGCGWVMPVRVVPFVQQGSRHGHAHGAGPRLRRASAVRLADVGEVDDGHQVVLADLAVVEAAQKRHELVRWRSSEFWCWISRSETSPSGFTSTLSMTALKSAPRAEALADEHGDDHALPVLAGLVAEADGDRLAPVPSWSATSGE